MLPEISARWSLLWAKVQIPIVTDRQWGRDKSAICYRSLSSTQLDSYLEGISQYITDRASYFLHMVHWSEFWCSILGNYTCALAETLISRFEAIIQIMLCFMPYVHVLHICNKIDGIYACAFAEQTKLSRAVYLLFPNPSFKLLVHELQDAFCRRPTAKTSSK